MHLVCTPLIVVISVRMVRGSFAFWVLRRCLSEFFWVGKGPRIGGCYQCQRGERDNRERGNGSENFQGELKVTDSRRQRESPKHRFPQTTAHSPLLLEIQAFGGCRKPQKTEDRSFSQKPQEAADLANLFLTKLVRISGLSSLFSAIAVFCTLRQTLRLLNALNSEDRGLKVRFSLATIAFDRESAQMLSNTIIAKFPNSLQTPSRPLGPSPSWKPPPSWDFQ